MPNKVTRHSKLMSSTLGTGMETARACASAGSERGRQSLSKHLPGSVGPTSPQQDTCDHRAAAGTNPCHTVLSPPRFGTGSQNSTRKAAGSAALEAMNLVATVSLQVGGGGRGGWAREPPSTAPHTKTRSGRHAAPANMALCDKAETLWLHKLLFLQVLE